MLSQRAYIDETLQRFGLDQGHLKAVHTPMSLQTDINNPECEDGPYEDGREYQSMVGSIMYAALGTRSAVAFAVTALSKFSSARPMVHLYAGRQNHKLLRLQRTLRIVYFLSVTSLADLKLGSFSGYRSKRTNPDWVPSTVDGPMIY